MRTAEEAVLLAALEDDCDEVLRRLREFLPGERFALSRACRMISEVIYFNPASNQSARAEEEER